MAAYAAVVSLKLTIERHLNSSRISIASSSRELLDFAYDEAESLQEVLDRLDEIRNSSEKMKALEGQMREATHKLEDAIEFHVSDRFLSQSTESLGGDEGCLSILSLDLQALMQDIDCFAQMSKKMKEEYIKELANPLLVEGTDVTIESSTTDDFDGNKLKMVGLSDQFHKIRDVLLDGSINAAVSIVGMPGIGKTTLAKKIFEDSSISRKFERRLFVKMGPISQSKEIRQAILALVNPDSDKMLMEEDEKLDEYFTELLNDRYLFIVLDDVWIADFWDDFTRGLVGNYHTRSRILITTRMEAVASYISGSCCYNMRFMNNEESWDLLRAKVFCKEVYPPELEKTGKKIAENCEGLPLLILMVADLLSKAEKMPEYWNKVAADKENFIFMEAYEQISKVLYTSYKYLPHYLKAYFLYMGAFAPYYDIRRSKLINLWSAEGLLERNPSLSLEDFAMRCFENLVYRNLVVVRQQSRLSDRVIACKLHSAFRYLCRKEAGNEKFLYILNSHADGSAKGIQSQRRLSIYKNLLFGMKEVYNSVASISTVRSLLCTGQYHQYQVPLCLGLRLLRVLDALTIHFYEFPMEVVKLVHLRYLALTYSQNLPSSISKLWNLQYLIIHQHLSIKSAVARSYLPVEIWDLQELKYLEIMGRNLPDPPQGAVLPNLLTLLDVGAHTCTEDVLHSIPNLEKLRVQIELAPDSVEPLSCFDHISHLDQLRAVTCVVVNPKLRFEIVGPPPTLSGFTSNLTKLTLSGLGYPWKDMNPIAELLSLKVLKLQCYAFQGEKWEVEEFGFVNLKYLLIEDTDLVHWWSDGECTFQYLSYLIMKNCYKLQKIPYIPSLQEIQLVDCNYSAATCAKMLPYGRVYAYSSWDEGSFKS